MRWSGWPHTWSSSGAARRVFERDGYLDAGVEEIVQEARVDRGSFYTYFTSKLDVFRVVTREVAQIFDVALVTRPDDPQLDPVDALCRSNLRYMTACRENARIYALTEQPAHTDEESLQALVGRRRHDVARVSSTIRRWQSPGGRRPLGSCSPPGPT